jgi:threonine dehydratase
MVTGEDLQAAEKKAKELARSDGTLFIEDGDDAGLMAGAATIAWEILDELPDASTIVVPVGGGNLISGVAIVAKRLRPGVRILGVQSAAAPAVYHSWKEKAIREAPCRTTAGGLATHRPGLLAFSVLKDLVDTMILVREAELDEGIRTVFDATGQIAEGAGAAPFAALKKLDAGAVSGSIVLILTGGNLPVADLRRVIAG